MAEPYHVTQARERLSSARDRLREIRAQSRAALDEANRFTDDHLTHEGLDAKRQELREAAAKKFEPAIEQLRAQIKNDAETAEQWLQKTQPKLGDDAAALMRAQVKWDQVRTQLQAGSTLRQVIATADQDTLLAIREWAPSHVTAEAREVHPGGLLGGEFDPEEAVTATLRAVDQRLAEVAGGDYASAFKTADLARAEASYAEPMLQHVGAELAGTPTDGLRAAVDAHFAAQAATGDTAVAAQNGGGGEAA